MSAFVRLEDTVNRLAGFHTGVSLHLHSDFLDEPFVRFHEDVHDRIFTETADGLLHHILLRYAASAAEPGDVSAVTEATDRLLLDTRRAHECAATYLGVQALLAPGPQSEAVRSLPPEYEEYYRSFEDLAGRFSASSVCRYEIGWACAVWVFGSPRVTASRSVADLASGEMWRVDGPDERLRRLTVRSRTVRHADLGGRFEEEVRAAFERDGIAWFPIGSDDAWLSRADSAAARRANSLVADCAGRLVAGLADGPAVSRFDVPVFLQDTAARLNLVQPSGDLWGLRGSDIPRRAAVAMASHADRSRIGRSAVPLDVLIRLSDGPDDAGTDRRLEMFLAVRSRAGEPVVLVWAGELDDPGGEFAPVWPVACCPSTAASLIRAEERRRSGHDIYLILKPGEWQDVREGEGPLSLFDDYGATVDLRVFGVPAENPPSGATRLWILLYARENWSSILRSQTGDYLIQGLEISDDISGPAEVYLCVFITRETSPTSYVCILSRRTAMQYEGLVALGVKEGRIRIVPREGQPPVNDRLVASIWYSFDEL